MFKTIFSRVKSSSIKINLLKSSNNHHFGSFDCNNCSKKTKLPECTACHRMINYFNIFNIPEQYNINEKVIEVKAKELQKEYHPDKHSFNEEMENFLQSKMKNYSAYINEAKVTLLDDLKRAIYMIELRGVEVEDSIEINDNNFMMEMFTLQEEIEEASIDACQEIKQRIETIIKNLQNQFDSFFKSQDMAKCKEFVIKYKYLHRALQNLNNKMNATEVNRH